MKLAPYLQYKSTGIRFLGSLPTHWNIVPLKRVAAVHLSNVDKHTVEGEALVYLCNYVDVYKNDFITSKLAFMKASASAEQIRRLTLQKGDVIITKDSESPDDIGVPALVAEAMEGVVCGYHLALLRPLTQLLIGPYLRYLLRGEYLSSYFCIHANGLTRYALGKYEIENAQLPLPSLQEQAAIAFFLDRETAKIDTLIAKQEKLIDLLKEKRQAVISHAVTKGLDPAVPMKSSGVEWLGDVPEHWTVSSLKYLVQTRKGVAFKSEDFCESGIPVVKASDIKNLTIRSNDVCLPNGFDKNYPKAVLRAGEIIVSTVGSTPDVKNSAVGQIGMVPTELDGSLLNQNTVVLGSADDKLTDDFLFFILQCRGYRDHLDLHAHGTANQASLSIVDMLQFLVPLPPFQEQAAIAFDVVRLLKSMQATEVAALRGIDLLKERRSALISAAVTGKIDVRDAVSDLQEAA